MNNFKRSSKRVNSIVRYLLLVILLSAASSSLVHAQKLSSGSLSVSSYIIDDKGNMYSWGLNDYGQLGLGNTGKHYIPVKVPFPIGVTGWKSINGEMTHRLAIGSDANLYTWGRNNYGQLGIDDTTDQYTPGKVSFPAGVTGWKSIAAGSVHSIVISNDGRLYACGANTNGQLGIKNSVEERTFTKVPFPNGVTGWIKVVASYHHTLAISNDSNLYAWGDNTYGELGIGNINIKFPDRKNFPVKVHLPDGVTGWTAIAAGFDHTLAIADNGSLYAWGNNDYGQLGVGNTVAQYTPVKVPLPDGVKAWTAIATGLFHSLALTDDGYLYAWGYNIYGQLGIGNATDRYTSVKIPVKVPFPKGVTNWIAITSGGVHSMAISDDGKLYAWGRNNYGQLGIGNTTSQKNSLVPVLALDGSGDLLSPIETRFNSAPEKFILEQNYPNPFNPTTRITYHLKNSAEVQLTVYDITGRQVIMLVNRKQSAGEHTAMFNGNHLSSGVYFYRLKTGNLVSTKKMILLK